MAFTIATSAEQPDQRPCSPSPWARRLRSVPDTRSPNASPRSAPLPRPHRSRLKLPTRRPTTDEDWPVRTSGRSRQGWRVGSESRVLGRPDPGFYLSASTSVRPHGRGFGSPRTLGSTETRRRSSPTGACSPVRPTTSPGDTQGGSNQAGGGRGGSVVGSKALIRFPVASLSSCHQFRGSPGPLWIPVSCSTLPTTWIPRTSTLGVA